MRRMCLFLFLYLSISFHHVSAQSTDCGTKGRDEWRAAFAAGITAGTIPDPSTKTLPVVTTQPRPLKAMGVVPTVTCKDIFSFEDTDGVLLTDYSEAEIIDLMVDASNALMTAYGDNFDFIGFFVNFDPFKKFGRAFYFGIENNVSGIGQPPFNDRAFYGIAGNNIEGIVMMWEVTDWGTAPPNTDRDTRLVMGQEFEHRFAVYLGPLLDGRKMQGESPCGGEFHWNHKIDGQGSGMSIREWIGSAPSVLDPTTCVAGAPYLCLNTDTGGVWSYTDLYMMGYVSPAAMDAGNSELRYMDDDCESPYNGLISNFSSADIIAAEGARVPNSAAAQKDFRTGWIMIYQPGSPPTDFERKKAARILNKFSDEWVFSSLGLGTMDNTLGLPNQGPVADAGPDQEIECAGPVTTEVMMDGTGSSDPDGDCLDYLWTAPGVVFTNETVATPSGDFPLGTTTVTLKVSDGIDEDTDTVEITVVDTTPPEITVELNRDVLWPPNHKLADICATVEVTDICDDDPTFELTSITSDEPDVEGDIAGAEFGTPDVKFQLRSERDGSGDGRKYTIVYTAMDDSGNETMVSVCVTVPHDQSGSAMASLGFIPNGMDFDPSSERFALIIPSTPPVHRTGGNGETIVVDPGFDATALDVSRIYVGNTSGAIRSQETLRHDVTADGIDDLALLFPISEARDLTSTPSGEDFNENRMGMERGDGPLGLHYHDSDGRDYLVPNIFRLGEPVPLLPTMPPAGSDEDDPGSDMDGATPNHTRVTSIYPNPFNPSVTIAFDLATDSEVSLRIYDVQGALVRSLARRSLTHGPHEVRWDGRDGQGRQVTTGIYFVRMVAGDYRATHKMVMIK